MKDPLEITKPCIACASWSRRWRRTRKCEACDGVRNLPIDLSNTWQTQPGFLVCGGPSLQTLDLSHLQLPGVVSMGVNNAASYARTTAMTFGDPQWKFHGSLFLDPKCMCFAPTGKLERLVRVRLHDGHFRFLNRRLRECPAVYGLPRTGKFEAATFLTDTYAHWGKGGKHEDREFTRLASMLLGVRLLHYLGCKTIYMLGVDFWMPEDGGYAWGGPRTSGNKIWWKIDSMLKEVRTVLEASDTSVYNCNPRSKCEAFDHVSYPDALRHARSMFEDQSENLEEWYRRDRMTEDQKLYPDPIEPW